MEKKGEFFLWIFKNSKKSYLQISFAWLFAIIVGIIILGLAIFATVKFIISEQNVIDVKTGREIGILLNPLETGFETGKTNSLSLPVETRIYNKCNNDGVFGEQRIQISQKSFNRWTETDFDVGFLNKYIFSESYVEGKKFYLFSKPFEFPFKVADAITMSPSNKKYCFVDAPERIENEITGLAQKNLFAKDCENSDDYIKVCFDGNDCDITVNENSNYVEKNNERVYFDGDALMYGAIFSDREIYECQLKRLMQRVGQLALLYKDKAIFISRVNCNSNLNTDLLALGNAADDFDSSLNLGSIKFIADEIKEKNDVADCKLW